MLLPALSISIALSALGQNAPSASLYPSTSSPALAPITLQSLLSEMTDRDALARFPDPPYTCKQFSSYDRASTSPLNRDTWFANDDFNKFLSIDESHGRKEWVMADMDGPGAVVRIWSANPKGTLRIYLDHAAAPVIEASMADVLGGKWLIPDPLSGVQARGYNLYLPVPYAKHCSITSDQDGFYYQVNYRTYSPAIAIRSFTPADLSAASALIKSTKTELLRPREQGPFQVTGARPLAPGEESQIGFRNDWAKLKPDAYGPVASPGAVRRLYIFLDQPASEQDLRSVILTAEFDGQQTIWAPLSDFFGLGVGSDVHFQDRYRRASTDGLSCDWIMPFKSAAKLTLKNLGSRPVAVHGMACVDKWSWDDRSMHFHAAWHAESPIHALGGRGTKDWNYVNITGKGVYVGDSLAVMNPVEAWWGEGDEKITVDNEPFPSHFGTGTEDYYGYAWCDPHVFQHPFHSQPRCDGNGKNNWGHTTVSRARSLDAIPFTRSLNFDMEIWHWAECDVAYAATTYWYALPGATCNIAPDPTSAKAPIPQPPPLPKPLKIAGAIECETMPIAARSDGLVAVAQDMSGFARATWSDDAQLWVQGRKVGDFIELIVKPESHADGPCRLTLHAARSWDYGIIRFTVNGQPAGPDGGQPIDLCSGEHKVHPTGPIDLGVFAPRPDGTFLLRAAVTGANPKAEGAKSYFGLDCIVVSPADK